MNLRIRLAAKTDPVSISVDAPEDEREEETLVFKEGRVIPVCYYYPGECRAYVLRNEGQRPESHLPNIDGAFEILLAVRGAEVKRLKAAAGKLIEEDCLLEQIPQAFWGQLGVLIMHRSFRLYMVRELYLGVQQRHSLLHELEMADTAV